MSPRYCWLLLGGLLFAGCASVKIQKIPVPSSYVYSGTETDGSGPPSWNDRQATADDIPGVRYYLPRPYMLVKQEFPVAGGTYLLKGTLDAAKNLVLSEPIPDQVAGLFAGAKTVPLDKAKSLATTAPGTQPVETQSGGSTGSAAKATAEAKPDLLLDSNDLLKDSTVGEAKVSNPKAQIRLTLKVSKDLEAKLDLGENETLDTKKVYLVPLKDGKHSAVGLVSADVYDSSGSTGTDRTLIASIEGSKVPTFAALGVKVTFDKDGEKKSVILHRKDFDILSVFIKDNGVAAGTKDDKTDSGSGTKDATEPKETSGAKASTSGDPNTDPLIYESTLYDLILLPDFSEQYAIQVRSGIFKATADIGLENGWMLEKFNTDIDNSQISKFLFDTAGKLVELGLPKLLGVAESMAEAAAAPEAASELQSATQGTGVTVRVDWLDYAVPGLYPLLRPQEACCPANGSCAGKRFCAPRIDYQTRRTLAITIVEFGGASGATGGNPGTPTPTATPTKKQIEDALGKGLTDEQKEAIFKNQTPRLCKEPERDSLASATLALTIRFDANNLVSEDRHVLDQYQIAITSAIKDAIHAPDLDVLIALALCN